MQLTKFGHTGLTASMDVDQISRPEGGSRERSQFWKIGVVFAISLGFIMAMLDVTVVNVALADVQREFSSPLSTLVWIVDAYMLTFASLLLLGGSLADWIGAKRAYISGLAIFVCASALCGFANSTALLIIARLLQGIGAAFFLPSSLTLLTQSFPDTTTRNRMIGLWGAFIGAAAGSGPFVGGLVVHQFGWRSIFYLNLPIGLLGVILTSLWLQPSRQTPRPFNFASHVLIVGALSAISFTLIDGPSLGWFSSGEILLAAFAVPLAVALFLWRERTSEHPVIPRTLSHNSAFWILNVVGFLLSFVLFGDIFVVSLFLEKARGASALMTGIQMLPIMGVFSFVNYFSGRLGAKWSGRKIMSIGFGTATLGAAATMLLGSTAPYAVLAISLAIYNAGLGLVGPALVSRLMSQTGETHANIGSATLSANRQIGALCGVAMMGLLLDMIPNWELSFSVAFAVSTVCTAIAVVFIRRGLSVATPATWRGEK